MTTTTTRKDPRDILVEHIIGAMSDSTAPWLTPWDADALSAFMPHNATTGRKYSGMNVFSLMIAQAARDFESSGWATFKQIAAAGGSVKGQKGTPVVFWNTFQTKDKDGKPATDEKGRPVTRGFWKGFTVFNMDQVEGGTFPATAETDREPRTLAQSVEDIIVRHGVKVRRADPSGAWYSPGHDLISVPPAIAWKSDQAYAATMLHELSHWTGHKDRLDRDQSGAFGSLKYATEELVAELSSFLTSATLGLPFDPQNHAMYLHSWSSGDAAQVRAAVGAAKKASDYLLSDGK